MYRLVEVGVLLMIFGSLEQNLYSAIKPSDENLEQGRNRDNGELFKLTLKIVKYLYSIVVIVLTLFIVILFFGIVLCILY